MKTMLALLALALATPLAAQTRRTTVTAGSTPAISLRPFFLVTGQQFAAKTTFEGVFGRSFEPYWGGGLQVALRNGIYVEASASRFKKTGQRAFLFNGQIFRLGGSPDNPQTLTATITPFEVTGGYRFRTSGRVLPYAGAGIGRYSYKEQSAFAEPSENVDTSHAGFLAVGGVELRVRRWVGIGADVQYTHIPGILGTGGLSKEAAAPNCSADCVEDDLGGIAIRFRVIVGR